MYVCTPINVYISEKEDCVAIAKEANISQFLICSKYFYDNAGRVRLFHGINQVNKGYPWYPDKMLNDTLLEQLEQWGFNSVRLGTMWTGVMPEKGMINTTYIDILKNILDKFSKHGQYAIMDMHQDTLSSKYYAGGVYDGAPRWLIDSLPKIDPKYTFPWPWEFPKAFWPFWELAYMTAECSWDFEQIYTNTSGALDVWSNFWSVVAENFVGNPHVLGYNLINEPWHGDVFNKPGLLLPGNAGKRNLLPVYDTLNDAIRTKDKVTPIFYEPTLTGTLTGDIRLGNGFERVPGGDEFRNRSVYSWHYYCWLLEFIDADSKPMRKLCDDGMGPQVFQTAEGLITRNGGAAFLTEFGNGDVGLPNNRTNLNGTTQVDFVMGLTDQYYMSWVYWDSDFWDRDLNIKYTTVQVFARTYPRALAGTPTRLFFDPTNSDFSLEYVADTRVTSPTEIYIPKRFRYPNGYNVTVSAGLVYEIQTPWPDWGELVIVNFSKTVSLPRNFNAKITIISK